MHTLQKITKAVKIGRTIQRKDSTFSDQMWQDDIEALLDGADLYIRLNRQVNGKPKPTLRHDIGTERNLCLD